ncbi:MAG TPA: FmdB family zinc ribbon protein [Rubrobacter sp.]|nr:FmdB family zinc ribbon protein [Rubrobacter sp.]
MPIYEYKCENGHVFDVMQKLSEDPLTTCVECGAPVRKVLHPVGISFKGSGFYSTDYSNNSKRETATKDDSQSSNGDSGKKDKPKDKSSEKSAGTSTSTGKKD